MEGDFGGRITTGYKLKTWDLVRRLAGRVAGLTGNFWLFLKQAV